MIIESVQPPRPRAGFWRRLLAFIIDYLIVFVPLYLVVAALFSFTNGAIQGNFLLRFGACYDASVDWGSISPAGFDVWKICKTSIFGITTASNLVGTSTVNGTSITFPLSTDGQNREPPFDLGSFETLVLFVYLFFMEWRSGQPIGKRIMAIAVRDVNDEEWRGSLPIRKAFRRQLAKAAGLLPMTLVAIAYAVAEWTGSVPTDSEQQLRFWIAAAWASMAIAAAWFAWIALSIILGRDPIHDRFATTIVRTHPA